MTAPGSPDPHVVAYLRLVQGRAATQFRELLRSQSQTKVMTVGSHADCDWQVVENGVAPVHFSLHWDGSALHIADTRGAGGVWVDGELLGSGWRRLGWRARIEFGQAAIVAETKAPPRPSRAPQPDSSTPPPASGVGSRYRGRTLMGVARVPTEASSPTPQPAGRQPDAVEASQLGQVAKPTIQGYAVQGSDAPGRVAAPGHASERPRPSRDDTPSGAHQVMGTELATSRPETGSALQRRVPGAVTILSPAENSSVTEPPPRPSSVRPPRKARPWRDVALGWLAVLAIYGGWIYLLYHL